MGTLQIELIQLEQRYMQMLYEKNAIIIQLKEKLDELEARLALNNTQEMNIGTGEKHQESN